MGDVQTLVKRPLVGKEWSGVIYQSVCMVDGCEISKREVLKVFSCPRNTHSDHELLEG